MAALMPFRADRDQDSGDIDQLVRELVSRGADVGQENKGNVFYTALSATCFCAGAGTINFLLDRGACGEVPDPVFGRLPLHFAAANGIENFRTIMLAYHGDVNMMRADKGGKTCLHWAAQFGNAETIAFILSRVAREGAAARARYVSTPDEDGWTPLCWAVRPYVLGPFEGMRSETPNHAAAVDILLKNGADPGIRCPLGNGDDSEPESLTLLELARRSGADDEVIRLLTEANTDRTVQFCAAAGIRKYKHLRASCDVCLAVGLAPHATEFLLPPVLLTQSQRLF
jgi:ankyrin repeat protein